MIDVARREKFKKLEKMYFIWYRTSRTIFYLLAGIFFTATSFGFFESIDDPKHFNPKNFTWYDSTWIDVFFDNLLGSIVGIFALLFILCFLMFATSKSMSMYSFQDHRRERRKKKNKEA